MQIKPFLKKYSFLLTIARLIWSPLGELIFKNPKNWSISFDANQMKESISLFVK